MNGKPQQDGDRTVRDQVAERAGYWDARLRSPDCTDKDRLRFAAWRDAHHDHRLAFERLQSFVSALRQSSGRADVRGLREAAAVATRRGRLWRHWAVAACLALIAVGAFSWQLMPQSLRDAPRRALASLQGADFYATGVGQRSTVTLEDGSSLELNATTRLEVKFDASHRSIRLLEGQAMFEVARDSRRPFIVRAADSDIMAMGTAFDVRLDARSVRVTLLEGKVNVDRSDRQVEHPQALVPGQQFIASLRGQKLLGAVASEVRRAAASQRDSMVRSVDIAKVMGWRDGQVFLEDLTLADAVAEMNRYSRVQIAVGDESLADLRVNGMFRAGQQAAFVAALQEYFPVTAHHERDGQITLRAR